jgi:metal-responsive CopG/Arc/MetJ family transcriptional regulator
VKVVQIVLDERTLRMADREARRAKVNRSALFRRALALYVSVQREREREERQREAYERKPVEPGEFDVWDRVIGWPET